MAAVWEKTRRSALPKRCLASALWIAIFLTACSGLPEEEASYRPPTLAITAVTQSAALSPASPDVTALPGSPTAEPVCVNALTFLEDVTIPDGTIVSAGEVLDKRWKVKNSGTCNWDDRYRLVLIGGAAMGAAEEQALYPARGSTEAVIRMSFTAPVEAGTYRSAWQAVDPKGQAFGDPFFVEIVVP